jgi:hypothetical protein
MIDTFFNLRSVAPVKMKFICPELYLMDIEDYYNIPLEETGWHEYISEVGVETIPYEHEEEEHIRKRRILNNELTTSVPFLRFNRNFGYLNFANCIELTQRKFEADTIICSARLLYEIMSGADISLKCKKLIVLDSLDTQKAKLGIYPDFDDLFDYMFKDTKVIQLSNPSNIRQSKYEQKEYFHKFSEIRLKSLKQTGKLRDRLVYERDTKQKTKLGEGNFENMGKGIFEHLYFKKEVDYRTDGMYCKDGLWYYLKLIGVDPEKNQVLRIPKSTIREKLFMRRTDCLRMEAMHEFI